MISSICLKPGLVIPHLGSFVGLELPNLVSLHTDLPIQLTAGRRVGGFAGGAARLGGCPVLARRLLVLLLQRQQGLHCSVYLRLWPQKYIYMHADEFHMFGNSIFFCSQVVMEIQWQPSLQDYNQNRSALKEGWCLERGFILHENMNRMVTEKSCLRRAQWSLIRVVFCQEFHSIINIASTDPPKNTQTHTHNNNNQW